MGDRTGIAWTEATWNPVTGCDKVSDGCDHCYAEQVAHRFSGTPAYPNGFNVTLRPERLEQPLRWRRPRMIFVNSMSDLFHPQVTDAYLDQVFDVMERATQHTFQVLTKRHARMRSYLRARAERRWAVKLWSSICRHALHWRSTSLQPPHHRPDCCPAAVVGLDWVIVGGESGPGARRMDPDWATALADECTAAGVAFFMKQTGTVLAKEWGLTGKGEEPAGWPKDLPRAYPAP